MRIIAGEAKGRNLAALRGLRTRPTAARVREALFDLLGDRIRGASMIDLFAGTGGVGIEALSRGARRVVFVEKDAGALRVLRKNIDLCRFSERAELLAGDVRSALRKLSRASEPFDFLFVDPPYGRSVGDEATEKALLSLPLSEE
ncbi:MAG: 16S rRNA (guanine(966)-N(2))-methyltransferase RsmD, partial [Vicinamibacteria bacterium]